jgi:DNA-directed RNA polymerase subunit RPC12/RpoP
MNIYQCLECGARNAEIATQPGKLRCVNCATIYKTVKNSDESVAGIVKDVREPLGIPKGSIRAFATLSMSAILCYLSFKAMYPPQLLMNLIITTVFYYFGFRKSSKIIHIGGRYIKAKEQQPLYLPQGFIRNFLILSILLSFFNYYNQGDIQGVQNFFSLMLALIFGYYIRNFLINKISEESKKIVEDIKAVVLILSVFALGIHWILDINVFLPTEIYGITISFYYGSRL